MLFLLLTATTEVPFALSENGSSYLEKISPNFIGESFEKEVTYKNFQEKEVKDSLIIRPCQQEMQLPLYFAYSQKDENYWINFFRNQYGVKVIGSVPNGKENIEITKDLLFTDNQKHLFGVGNSFGFPKFQLKSESEEYEEEDVDDTTSETEEKTFQDVVNTIDPDRHIIEKIVQICTEGKAGNQKKLADVTGIHPTTLCKLKNVEKYPRTNTSPSVIKFWNWLKTESSIEILKELTSENENELKKIVIRFSK